MPATIEDVATVANVGGAADGTITLTIPAGADDGDLLVLWAGARGLTSGTTTIDRPTGWTRLGTTQAFNAFGTTVIGGALFYRFHDSGDPDVTVTYGTGYQGIGAMLGVTVVRGAPTGLWSGSVAEGTGVVGVDTAAPDPAPTVRALILQHRAAAGMALGPDDNGFAQAWANAVGSPTNLAIACKYQTVDPGSYTMNTGVGYRVMSSVAIIDTPAGGIYIGHPIGGAGIVAIG